MSINSTVQQRNEALARTINDEALRDPKSKYAGKFIGLVDGQLFVVADNWDDVARRLDDSGVAAERMFCFEAGIDYDEPQYIWGEY